MNRRYKPMLEEDEEESRYSGGRDWSIGAQNRIGYATRDEENTWDSEEMAETGLNERKPL
ncbi:MAG: hypothetical protein DRI61_15725 [Chloroflexi bacterium]|nr:MAG: hypothetical protein DRI61_15725 [Chloroflexota bacterium]